MGDKRRKLTKEEQNQASILNGIIQGYKLDHLMKQSDRKIRRRWVKYFWLPIYALGNPVLTGYLYATKHWVLATLMLLYTIYGWGKMKYGDRFVLFLLSPLLKIISKKIFK